MAFQGGRNLYVNYKPQTTAGTLPSASSAMRFRVNEGSQGLNLAKATINSGENRETACPRAAVTARITCKDRSPPT